MEPVNIGFIVKTTIKLIRNTLAKFSLIANLTAKNLALHQQLIVLNRSIKRPKIKTGDRLRCLQAALSLLE